MNHDHDHNHEHDDQNTLYVHICHDGQVYLLPGDTLTGVWGDFSRLKAELTLLKEKEGSLLFSIDEIPHDEEPNESVNLIISLIDSFELDSFPVDPHPATNGFYRSYIPYIHQAIEVSEIDIEGTEARIADVKQVLADSPEGTGERRELEQELSTLDQQLVFAKYAHKKLLDLELDICTETEGEVQ